MLPLKFCYNNKWLYVHGTPTQLSLTTNENKFDAKLYSVDYVKLTKLKLNLYLNKGFSSILCKKTLNNIKGTFHMPKQKMTFIS